MKKFIVALLFACTVFSLSASDANKRLFEEFYSAIAKNMPKDQGAVRKNVENRIIFIDFLLPVSSNPNIDMVKAKAMILNELKKNKDSKAVIGTGITLVYNYITTDRKIYTVVVSQKDF